MWGSAPARQPQLTPACPVPGKGFVCQQKDSKLSLKPNLERGEATDGYYKMISNSSKIFTDV